MAKILILFAHPAFQRSRVNRVLAEAVQNLANVTFHDLYENYAEFDIDVEAEQELLSNHDVIVFQHPFFWYSTPSLLKEWQDLVLTHGWAYGSSGKALRGKKLISVITTGGRDSAYHKQGYNRFTINQLLVPIEQTAYLCGMEYLPPFTVHGTFQMAVSEIAQNAERYKHLITMIRDNGINFKKAQKERNLNTDLSPLEIKERKKNERR